MLPLTVENLILTIKEFLNVWISQILYYKEIYNLESFTKFKSFDLIIFKSRNPVLNEYLNNLINNFLKILLEGKEGGKLNQLIVILYNVKSDEIKQKYILNFNDLINLNDSVSDLSFLSNEEPTSETLINISALSWNEIYSQIRSLLFHHINELKRNSFKNDATNDIFFKVIVELDDSINLDSDSTNSNWIKLNHNFNGNNHKTRNNAPTKYFSIGEVSLGIISFDLHNEYVKS